MIKLQGIEDQCCVMCGAKEKTYTLDFQNKSGRSIIALALCGKCIKRCHSTMGNFIDAMLRGESIDERDN